MTRFDSTPADKILQLLHDHMGDAPGLMLALRDIVDEYEAEKFYHYYEWVSLQSVHDGASDNFRELSRRDLLCSTGYRGLDQAIGGFRREWLYMITGDPCSGKTPLLYNLALEVCQNQRNQVMLYSMSTDSVGVARRMYTSITERHRAEVGDIDTEETFAEEGDLYHPCVDKYKIDISADNPRNLEALCNDILFHYRDREVKYFFIDDPEELFSDSPPHVLPYRRRIMYEKFKELCQTHKICIVMARRSEPYDVTSKNTVFPSIRHLESRGYRLRDVDVVMYFGSRPDADWHNPIRRLKIIKYPRQLKRDQVYLYHVFNRDYIRNLRPDDIERDPAPKYFYTDELFKGAGLEPETTWDQWMEPPF